MSGFEEWGSCLAAAEEQLHSFSSQCRSFLGSKKDLVTVILTAINDPVSNAQDCDSEYYNTSAASVAG